MVLSKAAPGTVLPGLVLQEREIRMLTKALASVKIFTAESYKKQHGRDLITDDNLIVEDWKSPTGSQHRVMRIDNAAAHLEDQYMICALVGLPVSKFQSSLGRVI